MVKPITRRVADPQVVIHLWDVVHDIKQQKQVPVYDRIGKAMEKTYGIDKAEAERQLRFATEDGIMISYNSVKGTRNYDSNKEKDKKEYEQEAFKLPEIEEEVERDDHDWYCFDCHQPGEVVACNECWRVYHPTCTEEPWTGETFVCSICVEIKRQPRMRRKELNKLISYTVSRLKSKVKELYRVSNKEEDQLKIEKLVYRQIDVATMDHKAKDRKYKYLEQFYADCRNLVHNTFICYGDSSILGGLAKFMLRDAKYDLDEIRQCKDCYYYSNAKPKDWFCQPCRPPHELVYAKQKGFSFWPAKVIKVTKEGYDVRFFGSGHTRAIVPENLIRPIDTALKQLTGLKRTAGFTRACDECKRHQELLEKAALEQQVDPSMEEEDEELEHDAEEEYEPVIKHKKFRKKQREEEREVSSSSFSDKLALTPEDQNLVTSTESTDQADQHSSSRRTSEVAVQTSKKMLNIKSTAFANGAGDQSAIDLPPGCNCAEEHETKLTDLSLQMEKQYSSEKRRAIKEVEERLRKEFEQDKQQAASNSSVAHQKEIERIKRRTEERCREAHLEELKKLAAKSKAEISATKKKQWCYNCEEEAMYHCCWNTSYCSIKCQQEHWHREHKRMCRRQQHHLGTERVGNRSSLNYTSDYNNNI